MRKIIVMIAAVAALVFGSLPSVNAADAGQSTLDRLSKPLEDAAVDVTTTVAKGFQYEGGNKLGDVDIDVGNKIKTLVSTLGFVRIGNVTITKTEIPGKVKITVKNDSNSHFEGWGWAWRRCEEAWAWSGTGAPMLSHDCHLYF